MTPAAVNDEGIVASEVMTPRIRRAVSLRRARNARSPEGDWNEVPPAVAGEGLPLASGSNQMDSVFCEPFSTPPSAFGSPPCFATDARRGSLVGRAAF